MCARLRNTSTSVIPRYVTTKDTCPPTHQLTFNADCKTDVYFNTLSLLFPLIGGKFDIWWLDPVGAALLSLYIIYDWASTCLENVSRLSGIGAEDEVLRKLMYLAWRFSPVVDGYKSLKAYHVSTVLLSCGLV